MTDRASGGGRSARTLSYTGGLEPQVPVAITIGPAAAATINGQIAVLTAANMLARVHPGLILVMPEVPLLVPCPAEGGSLPGACARLALAANPDLDVARHATGPAGTIGIGIGADAPPASIYAGAQRWTARTSHAPLPLTDDPSSLIGVGMAVAHACAWAFRRAVALPVPRPHASSLWTMTQTVEATGPSELGPVDVGTVWMVGAGAVGSGLAWWLQYAGLLGDWLILDGDDADETNLNRSLGLFTHHLGSGTQAASKKARAAAELVQGAKGEPLWWNDWVATDPASPDVLIPVANEFGVRPAIAAYGHPAVLYAATSPNWSAELYAHRIGHDGCIACRFPEDAPRFKCSTAPVKSSTGEAGNDAALPFLSGAAGLLILAGLAQLQRGRWGDHGRNHWRWWFDDSATQLSSSRWSCSSLCTAVPQRTVREAVHSHTRWFPLDAASTQT